MKKVVKKIKDSKVTSISEVELFHLIKHIDFTSLDLDYLFNELEKAHIAVIYP